MCRVTISVYSTLKADNTPLQMPYSSMYGSMYVRDGRPGLGSFHFVSDTECFVSFEHSLIAELLPKLDDGSQVPRRLPFGSPNYDAARRTFTAVVDLPKAWGEVVRFRYLMQFSCDFDYIECGACQSQTLSDDNFKLAKFGMDKVVYERHDLVDFSQHITP